MVYVLHVYKIVVYMQHKYIYLARTHTHKALVC